MKTIISTHYHRTDDVRALFQDGVIDSFYRLQNRPKMPYQNKLVVNRTLPIIKDFYTAYWPYYCGTQA